jgi:hypothetical protein
MVFSWKLDIARTRNVLGKIASALNVDGDVFGLWMMSVGTRIVGKIPLISIWLFILTRLVTAPGLAPCLSKRAHHCCPPGRFASEGAKNGTLPPEPHACPM